MEAVAALTPAQPTVLVIGGPADRAAGVLRASGWATRVAGWVDGALAGAEPREGDIVLYLGGEPDAALLDTVRALTRALDGVPAVVVMPAGSSTGSLRKVLRAGACGIVFDDALARALAPTLAAVAEGQIAVPRSLRNQVAPRPLSFREKQIVGLVVMGLTNREIANKLFLAESTVKTHLSSAFSKLDARSRAEAAALILDPEEGYGLGILSLVDGERPPAAG